MTSISTQGKAFASLCQLLPPRGPDEDYWWRLTGPQVARLLEAAGYSFERQYASLLFHYHWMIPYLGARPDLDGTLKWESILGLEGSPIEYSWKWNTPTKEPDIRYTIEPIGQLTGTDADPLNQQAGIEMAHRLAETVPGVDLTWFNHFVNTLYDNDRTKYTQELASGAHYSTSIMTAAEFVPKGLRFKTYFIPRPLGRTDGRIPMSHWEDAFAKLEPNSPARATLHKFLETSPEGKHLIPFMVAVDNVKPSESRMKFYFQTGRTAFDSVREVMTLGGRNPVPEQKLEDLRTLICAATGLGEDYPAGRSVPSPPGYDPCAGDNFKELPFLLAGYQYYFDVAPAGAGLPEVKFYASLRCYGADDRAIAGGIVRWMGSHGRGAYTRRYLAMMESLGRQHRRLEDGKGLQAYVSCLITSGGELDITTYIGAEAFAPGRLSGPNTSRNKIGGPSRARAANGTTDGVNGAAYFDDTNGYSIHTGFNSTKGHFTRPTRRRGDSYDKY